MRYREPVLHVALLLAALLACGGGEDASREKPQKVAKTAPPPVAFTEAGTDRVGNHFFDILVVPRGTTWATVCRLGVYLHKLFPLRRYDIRERGHETEEGAVINTYGAGDRLRWGLGSGGTFKGAASAPMYWLEP